MDKITAWFAAKRWRSSLAHALMALGFMVPFVLLALITPWFLLCGVMLVVGWFHGREKVQHEYRVKGTAQTATVFFEGWNPKEWDFYSRVEFGAPVVAAVATAIFWVMVLWAFA